MTTTIVLYGIAWIVSLFLLWYLLQSKTEDRYGDNNSHHLADWVDVEQDENGKVIAVWYRSLLRKKKLKPRT